MIEKATSLISLSLVAASLSLSAAWGGEEIGERLSDPMPVSELVKLASSWSNDEELERRPELIALIREGSPAQVQNAALLLRRLSPPFTGVASVVSDRAITFTKDAYTIYGRMVVKETGPDLGLVLDELLMSGSGMLFSIYGKPIREMRSGEASKNKITGGSASRSSVYSSMEIATGRERAVLLEKIAREFPESRFIPFSELAIGDVFLEMFLFAEKHDIDLLQAAISAYDQAFRRRIEAESGGDTDRRLLDDLGVRLAIANVLLGDFSEARSVLERIDERIIKNDESTNAIDQVYISKFLPFYSEKKNTIFNTYELIDHLRNYIDNSSPFDSREYSILDTNGFSKYLEPLVSHLDSFVNSDYQIIFYSTREISDAESRMEELLNKARDAGITIDLKIVGKNTENGWYGISTVEKRTKRDAEDLREMLGAADFPSDAYLRRPKSL